MDAHNLKPPPLEVFYKRLKLLIDNVSTMKSQVESPRVSTIALIAHILFLLCVWILFAIGYQPENLAIVGQAVLSLSIQIVALIVLKVTNNALIASYLFVILSLLVSVAFVETANMILFMILNLKLLALLLGPRGTYLGILLGLVTIFYLKFTSSFVDIPTSSLFTNAVVLVVYGILEILMEWKHQLHTKDMRLSEKEFITRISHELRTPLFGIIGGISVIDQNVALKDQENLLSIIKACSENLLRLIDQMLDFAKNDFAGISVKNEPVEIKRLCDDVIKVVSQQAEQRGHTIKLSLAKNLPAYFESDCTKVQQILTNLVFNSVKYTPPNGLIEIQVSLKDSNLLGLNGSRRYIEFTVVDNGIGIEEDEIGCIFETFHRSRHNTGDNDFGGVGLGLAIAKRLSELIGGKLKAFSEGLNKGCVFTLTIPLRIPSNVADFIQEDSQTTNLVTNTPLKNPIDIGKTTKQEIPTILVADDSKVNQYVLQRMIKQFNADCKVHFCGDGLEVLDKVEQTNYSLILMDIEMPNMDGRTTAKRIREMGIMTPIIVVSGHRYDSSDVISYVNEFVYKPLPSSELKKLLNKYLVV